MILIDTSAWIEYLRATGSAVHLRVREILDADKGFAVCQPIRMEVLMGARDEAHARRLASLLARGDMVRTEDRLFDEAASLYRQCRRRGEVVRKAMDCLIAAHAVDESLPVLHRDADFHVLARHTRLAEDPASLP